MASDVTLKAVLIGEDRSLSKTMKGAGDSVEQVGKKSKTAGAVMKGALSAEVVMRAADAVMEFGRATIEAASKAEQSSGAVDAVFKKDAAAIKRSAKSAAEDLGLSEAAYQDLAATLGAGLKNKGLDDYAGKTKNLIKIGADLAAQYGGSTQDAVDALGSAMRGEMDPIERYGVSLNQAAIQAEAVRMGLVKGKAPLTDQQKAMAALSIISKQTADAQGAFSRESGTAAGAAAIAAAKYENAKKTLGVGLLPVVTAITQGFSQLVDWISQNVSWLGPLATGLAVVAGAFAILNAVMALNPFVLVVVAIGALVAGLIWCYQNVEGFRNDVNRAFEAIGAVARWLWNNAFAPALRAIVSGFGWVVDGIAGFLEALGSIPGFEWAKGAAANLRGLAQGARAAADGIKNIPDPKVNTGNSRAQIVALDKKIKSLKGKVVEAKAKGDTKEVERLQKKIRELRGKKVTIEANVRKTGPSKITIRSVGGGVYKIGTSYFQADGGILATLADGRVVQRFADGGFEDHQAQIAPAGRGGAVRVWAEGETGGEAYIPLAASKRTRSREIWRETGKRLGMTEMADGGLLLADTSQMLRRRELATASAVVGRAGSGGGDVYYVTLTAPPGAPRAWAEATERELYGLMKSRGPGGKLIFQKG